jgi:MFS family permease
MQLDEICAGCHSAQMEKSLWSTIRGVYVFSFFQSFLVIIPVIVPFWSLLGINLQQVFTLQAIFGATLIALDLPAGYVADLFGRRRALIAGSLIAALGFQFLWFARTFWEFAIYEVILAVGLALQSGCDIALLYNSLDRLKISGQKSAFLGRRMMFHTMGEGVASLLGGLLAAISLNLPAQVNAVTGWLPLFAALSLTEVKGDELPRGQHLKNFKALSKAMFGHSRLLTFAIFNFIFYSFATYAAVWIFQPFWQNRGVGVAYFGYLWALNCFLVAAISRFAHTIDLKIGNVACVALIAICPVIGYIGMGSIGGWIGIGCGIFFPLCRGLNQILLTDAINHRVPPTMRATANSVGSLGFRALFIVFGPWIGVAIEKSSVEFALRSLGFIYVAMIFLVALPLGLELLKEQKSYA